MSAEEVESSEAAYEPNFEFATPSDALGTIIPETPGLSSAPSVDDSYQASSSSDVDFMEPKTSTPSENNLEDDDSDAVEEEKVDETDVNEEEMLTDDEDSNMEFKSFAENNASEKQVSADDMPSELLSNVMEISEDESEELEIEEEDYAVTNDSFSSFAASNESFASAANESFFSTRTQLSLNTSNVSFSSALDATLIGDDDDDDPVCPITKKRRSEINKEDSMDNFEVDDLCFEQISPSKFWAPPALSKISRQPEPSTSDIDLR